MTTSATGFGKFLLLLLLWLAGSAALFVVSILSINMSIVRVMLVISGVCLPPSLIFFFTERHRAAFLFAAGPFFVIGALLALSQVLIFI